MQWLIKDIEEKAEENKFFRQVLISGKNTQVVIMNILTGEDIGMETHPDSDQVLYFVEGKGKASVGGEEVDIEKGDIVLVPAGTPHNFMNIADTDLKIITTYSPPHHPQGTVHESKADAEKAGY